MATSKGQETILDALLLRPLSVIDLMDVTGLSSSFIRNQVKYLEAVGSVEKVDQRVPYIYKIPMNHPMVKLKTLIEGYEKELLNPDTEVGLAKYLQKAPKSKWPTLSEDLEAASIAIRNLESKGLLIETLE